MGQQFCLRNGLETCLEFFTLARSIVAIGGGSHNEVGIVADDLAMEDFGRRRAVDEGVGGGSERIAGISAKRTMMSYRHVRRDFSLG